MALLGLHGLESCALHPSIYFFSATIMCFMSTWAELLIELLKSTKVRLLVKISDFMVASLCCFRSAIEFEQDARPSKKEKQS